MDCISYRKDIYSTQVPGVRSSRVMGETGILEAQKSTREKAKMPVPGSRISYLKRLNLVNGVKEMALMRKKSGDKRGVVVCPLTRIFDAIFWTHYRCDHVRVPNSQTTPTHVLKHNRKKSKKFISLCPSCNKDGPTIPPSEVL
jgi:hypothetical protein